MALAVAYIDSHAAPEGRDRLNFFFGAASGVASQQSAPAIQIQPSPGTQHTA